MTDPKLIVSIYKQLKKNRAEEQRLYNEDYDNDDVEAEGDESDYEKKAANYKYDVQERLKEKKTVLSEEYLRMDDQSLNAKVMTLVKNINENVKALQNSRYNQFFKTETAIISSLYKVSKNTRRIEDLRSLVPKKIMINKHIYEKIFSLLQLHP